MAKEPKSSRVSNYDPDKLYNVKLAKMAKHGNSVMHPRDSHVVLGSAISDIEPQSAIKSVELA